MIMYQRWHYKLLNLNLGVMTSQLLWKILHYDVKKKKKKDNDVYLRTLYSYDYIMY